MTSFDENMRQAYIDSQLTIEETLRFEASLRAKELSDLQNERHFNDRITKSLSTDTTCPDALWDTLKTTMQQESKVLPFPWRQVRMLAFVASIAILLSVSMTTYFNASPHILLPQNIAEAQKRISFSGNYDEVSGMLRSHHYLVGLKKVPVGDHSLVLLGIEEEYLDKGKVAKIYFNCCSSLITVVIPHKDFPHLPAQLLFEGAEPETKLVRHLPNDFSIQVASNHDPSEALAQLLF